VTRIFTELITRSVDNHRFEQLMAPFIYESDILKEAGLKYRVTIPAGFVQDFESLPLVRGRNVRGGVVHDFFSCINSDPVVTKWMAADLYAEINAYTDAIDHGRGAFTKVYDWMRRSCKAGVVRFWPGFFHKRLVEATCLEIAGVTGDQYVTIEKLEALIEKTEQVSEDLKDKDVESEQTEEMVEKTDQITEDLKIEKEKAIDLLPPTSG